MENPNPTTPEPSAPKAPPIEIDTGGLHSQPNFQPNPNQPVNPTPEPPEREQPTEPDIEPGREGT